MKRRDNLNFGVVDGCGLDFDFGARWQAAKEIDDTAAANQAQRGLPRGRIARGLDDRIRAALIFSKPSHGGDRIWRFANVDRCVSAEPACDVERCISSSQRDNANSTTRQHAHKFQSYWPAADDHG